MDENTHCQICGRLIKASTGKIAHHGYRRPGGGWQTASCLGARYEPYEVSRDRIPAVFEVINEYIESTTARIADLKLNPPDELSYTRGSWKKETIKVQRPEGFTASNPNATSHRMHSYEAEFFGLIDRLERSIKSSQADLLHLAQRFADWKEPATITETTEG